MSVKIQKSLNSYLNYPDYLIFSFGIIGYKNEDLLKNDDNLENINLELSIISGDISKYNIINQKYLIERIFPNKVNIINILNSTKKPEPSNIIFLSSFYSYKNEKIYYFCNSFRFYEKYKNKNNNEYYIPKTFVILSQFPFYTTFYKICLKIYNEKDNIPIESFFHYVENIPSPINNNLIIKGLKQDIFIPILAGYPYIYLNLLKVFDLIPIKDFIKIYILVVQEIDLIFFYPNLENLYLIFYIFYILNYPLTESNYLSYIKVTSIDKIGDTIFLTIFGIIEDYNSKIYSCEDKCSF